MIARRTSTDTINAPSEIENGDNTGRANTVNGFLLSGVMEEWG